MKKRPKVETVEELKDNIRILENYLELGSGKEYEFAVNLIYRGIDFIVYVTNDDNELHFAPSRFCGYRDNNYHSHSTQFKSGSETTPKIQSVMKITWQANNELNSLHESYCRKFGKKQNTHKKKFIFLDKKARARFKKKTKSKNIFKSQKAISNKSKQIVEMRAVEYVMDYYLNKSYSVKSFEKDNVGWDLSAINPDGEELKIEVKGLSGKEVNIELTPNEYSKSFQPEYRICVVTNTLNKPNLYIFKKVKKLWLDENDNRLVVAKKVAARFTMAN